MATGSNNPAPEPAKSTPPPPPAPTSATKPLDQAAPAPQLSHGEEPGWVTARRAAERQSMNDPAGQTPTQMRPGNHDPAVDPAIDDNGPTRTVKPDGMDPGALPDSEPPITGGTLPPV
jgi:hypothetical protein